MNGLMEREVGVGTLGETGRRSGACRGSGGGGGGGGGVEEGAGLSAGEDRKEVVRM